MKKILIGIIAIIVIASSCKKKPEACIEGPQNVVVGEEVIYTFCGENFDNAREVRWYNSDGHTQEGGESFTTSFSNAGQYSVNLDMEQKTLSGNSSTSIHSVTVSNSNPKLHIRAKDYLYDQGIVGNIGIANASVKIYTNKTCWQNEDSSDQCLVAEGITDTKGKLVVEGLDVDLAYVVEIQTENSLNNWSNNIREMEIRDWANEDGYGGYQASYTNDYPLDIIVRYSPMAYLIKASQWKITDFKLNGTSQWGSVSDCTKDNYLTFDRDLNWNYSEGADICTPSTESSGTFNWISNQSTSSEFLEDYYVSMATLTGSAGFSGGPINVTEKSLTITSSVGGNTVESIFTRVD